MQKNESLAIANDVLAMLQNIQDDNDAKEFLRIYLDLLQYNAEQTGAHDIDKPKIMRHVKEVDQRFEN